MVGDESLTAEILAELVANGIFFTVGILAGLVWKRRKR